MRFSNAHKLRAPVASILGLIKLFGDDQITDEERSIVIEKLKKSNSDLDEVIRSIKEMLEEGEGGN